jgi:hypothetical protein
MSSIAPALAQSTFTPSDESPEDFRPGAGREEASYVCTACHGFKLVAQQGMTARAVGRFHQPDDPPPQHAAARRQGPRGGAELSRGDVSAASASRSSRLAEPVGDVKAISSSRQHRTA